MKAWRFWLLGALALGACGDDDAMPDDAGALDAAGEDAGPECVADEDCDDGLFCNGAESCLAGACVDGAAIACDDGVECTLDVCDEELARCVFAAPDADGDGVRDAACTDGEGMPLGADCDDDDANRFPGNPEVCDEDGHDEDCDLETFGAIDRDGDGYFDARCCNPTSDGTGQTCGLDCDDVRPNVNPAATEACDRVDNDCNGTIDEGVLVMGFADADRDGYGDFDVALEACPGEAGFVPAGGDEDCDDADRTRNPGQVEVCDAQDNDCDETVDESPQVVDWFRDLDGDGFGSAASGVVRSCTPVAGHVLLGTDCNDGVAGVNPAAAEVCNGLDDDCTGGANFQIAPGDFEDDDGDGVADVGCGLPRGIDCDDLDPITAGGSAEACDGRDNDCDDSIDEGAMDTLWYWDGDRDGHGSPANPDHPVLRACRPQPGYVASGGDCDDVDPMRSPSAAERCNSRDDDCDGSIDERNVCGCAPGLGDCNDDDVCETNTGADRNNCGTCGNVCTVGPNARGVSCNAGVCTPTGCRLGYDDCDGIASNGCETFILADAANCGACGEVCTAPPGTNVAAMGCEGLECDIESCMPGFDDCDGDPSNGCETAVSDDPMNCGRCFHQCDSGVACAAGFCNQPCTASTRDCDMIAANGCEVRIDQSDNCGACGNSCGGSACRPTSGGGYECEVRCDPGFADCDGNPGNGCETAVSFTACGCGGGAVDCGMVLGPLAIGVCRGVASGDAVCETTGCGGLDCGGRCVDPMTDPRNCGSCGNDCGSGTCVAGGCDCGTLTFCGMDGCVDIFADRRHCGGCGIDCGSGNCVGGGCEAVCSPGFGDCDLDPGNGCEVDLSLDPANCGRCGDACPSPTLPANHVTSSFCSASRCDYTCEPGFGDCNRFPSDGCELALATDPGNCGACGRSCGAAGTCSLGTCDRVVEVVLGEEHSCALRSGGDVVCWGANSFGQLGLSGGGAVSAPAAPVDAFPGFGIDLAAGQLHTCAITDVAGAVRVYCWGNNSNGQLGNAATGGSQSSPQLVSLPGSFLPTQLALGDLHSCVLGENTMGPEVYCWGRGVSGELGDGSATTAQNTPVRVEVAAGTPLEAQAIAAGGSFTCAVPAFFSAMTELQCWGANDQGQLGRGTTGGSANRPVATVPFGMGSGTVQIALGRDHACALDGPDLWCWGDNTLSQLDASAMDLNTPTLVMRPLGSPRAIALGPDRTCLHLADGTVRCRGDNTSTSGIGATVPGAPMTMTSWQRVLELGSSVQKLFLGANATHQCAQTSSGQIYSWGENQAGRLGIGTAGGLAPATLVGALTP